MADDAAPDAATGSEGSGLANDDFTLSDSVMNADLEEVEVPAEADASAGSGAEGSTPAPEGADKPAAIAGDGAKPPAAAGTAPVPVEAPKAAAAVEPVRGAEAPKGTAVPDLSSMAPDALVGELARNRDVLIGHIAETRFQLSQQEKDALETDAVGAIPKLLARVYFEAATTALNQLSSHAPRLIEQITGNLRTVNAAEDQFYSKWPSIQRGEKSHTDAVQMAANMFRQSNPNATQEQAIDVVGRMVTSMLNLQAAPAAAANGTVKRPPAFSPAGSGARPVSASVLNTPKANPFDGLGAYFDQ